MSLTPDDLTSYLATALIIARDEPALIDAILNGDCDVSTHAKRLLSAKTQAELWPMWEFADYLILTLADAEDEEPEFQGAKS